MTVVSQSSQVVERAHRNRIPLFSLLAANAVSTVGNSLTIVAVPWFILETTGSAAKTGLAGAALALGGILASVLGGPLVDRLGFKRASVVTDLACFALVAAIPLLHLADVLTFAHLVVLAFFISSFNSPGDAARFALVPELAAQAHMTPERANAADRGIARGAQLVGPLIAGVLIALIGPTNVLLLDAVTFAVSAALIALMVPSQRRSRVNTEPSGAGQRSYLRDLMVGLRFVGTNSLIMSVVLVVAVGNALDAALLTVLLPVYANDIWGDPASLGAVLSALGAGALAGTFLFGAIGHRIPRRATFLLGGAIGSSLLYGTLSTTPALPVVLVVALLSAVVAGPIFPLVETTMQRLTPPELLGRAFGSLQALSMVGVPFGAAAAGVLIQDVGLAKTALIFGGIYLVATLGAFLNPVLRRLDTPREVRSDRYSWRTACAGDRAGDLDRGC
jgi:MFS family permease